MGLVAWRRFWEQMFNSHYEKVCELLFSVHWGCSTGGGVNVSPSNDVVIASSKTLKLTPNDRKTRSLVDLDS
ncbi:hypothetical protein HMPREF1290_01233 [Corynebacterium sp. KPL1989]|nr:hypothetical protein HMPREF1290_01233 [Corynebacterium sp. KPL1989]